MKSLLLSSHKAITLFQDKTYSLEFSPVANEYCLVSIKTDFCNWIIRYESGRIAYDKKVCDSIHKKVLRHIEKHCKTNTTVEENK